MGLDDDEVLRRGRDEIVFKISQFGGAANHASIEAESLSPRVERAAAINIQKINRVREVFDDDPFPSALPGGF